MIFTHGWFLAGVGAIAGPIIAHLWVRSTFRTLKFPALQLLKQSHQQRRTRNHIYHILLLLLRCAIIIMVALAFAGPALPIVVDHEQKQDLHLLLIDNTVSTALAGADGHTVFDQIKSRAAHYVANAPENAKFSLFSFSAGSIGKALTKHQTQSLIDSLSMAATQKGLRRFPAALQMVDRQKYVPHLYLAGDFSPSVLKDLAAGGPANICASVTVETVRPTLAVNNTAITAAGVRGTGPETACWIQLENRGADPAPRTITATCAGDDLGHKDLVLLPQQRKIVDLPIDLSDQTNSPAGSFPLELRLSPPDDLPADDVYRLGLRAEADTSVRILLWAENPRPTILTRAALTSLAKFPATKDISLQTRSSSDFDPAQLTNPDIVIASVSADLIRFQDDLEDQLS